MGELSGDMMDEVPVVSIPDEESASREVIEWFRAKQRTDTSVNQKIMFGNLFADGPLRHPWNTL